MDPVSSDFNVGRMPEMIDMTEDPSGSIEPEQTTDSIQIQMDPTQQSVPTGQYDGDLVDTGILPEPAQDIDTLVQPDCMQEGPNGPDTIMDSNVPNSDKITEVSTHPDEPDRGIDNAANIEPNSDNHVDKTTQETEAEVTDKNQPGPESTDLLSEDTTEQQEIQVNQPGTDLNNISVDPATAKQLRDREAVLKLERLTEDQPHYNEDSTDSELSKEQDGAPVPVESDGWEPESNRRRRKRQTTVIPTTSGQLAVQTVSIKKRIPRKRKHSYHLCGQDFDMQSQFTTHMRKTHPNDMFQCEHCAKTLESANGLFKHQRSHLYLKHPCEVCERRFQFPGQKERHMKIHTQKGLYRCLHCPKEYTTNSGMLEHAKSHGTSLQCELCLVSTEKRYNSKYSLAQHTRGMHGGGWTSPCKKNFKWKSRYSRHLGSCEDCKALHKLEQRKRYLFLEESDTDSDA